jgi:hypothetical protein
MEPGQRDVGVRAALHALDAALAEHRRATRLAADARERERMAGARAVKAAAAASAAALEQPVERPLRGLRLGETWIEVDGVRHPLTAAVRARLDGTELNVTGDGWSARLVLPPGEGPAAAAREAAARIEVAARSAATAAPVRLARVADAARAHAAACHAAAAALAAADRRTAELHADRRRADACLDELAARLGPRRADEPGEAGTARARLEQARLYLDSPVEQPYAWIDAWPPELAGAILRDLPDEPIAETEDALRRVLAELREDEPILALARVEGGVAAVTGMRVLGDGPLPERLAEIAELVRAAGPRAASAAAAPAPAADDPVELLRRLGQLRDAGVVSAAEFEAKKAELLRRI